MGLFDLKLDRRAYMRTLPRSCVGMAPQSKPASRVSLLMDSFLQNLVGLLFCHVKMWYNIIISFMEFLLLILFILPTILCNQVNCPIIKHLL